MDSYPLPRPLWWSSPYVGEHHATGLESFIGAIIHSRFALGATRSEVAQELPLASLSALVRDRFERLSDATPPFIAGKSWRIPVKGMLLDPGAEPVAALLQSLSASQPEPQVIDFGGVVYTAVLNPMDGRKGWERERLRPFKCRKSA